MNTVIFCEGKTDVYFLDQIIKQRNQEVNVKKYISEDLPPSNRRGEQSEAVRNLVEPNNPYEILLKSEEGLDQLTKVIPGLLQFLGSQPLSFHIMIDLDGGNLTQFVDEINSRCRSRMPKPIIIGEIMLVKKSEKFICKQYAIKKDGVEIDTFCIFAFFQSLESSAGISGDETQSEKYDKVNNLITTPEIRSHINNLVNI